MSELSRRAFLGSAVGLTGVAGLTGPAAVAELKSLTANAQPIAAAERRARIEKLQGLMAKEKIAAFLVESGSTLEYFTGIRWHRSERTTAAVTPARMPVG